MKRTYKRHLQPTAIEVDGQTFLVHANSERGIFVQAPRDGVTIRGIPLSGHDHFQIQDDGSWRSYHELKSQSLGLKRLDLAWPKDSATPAMEKTFRSMMQRAVTRYLEERPLDLVRAQAIDANNDIERLDGEIDKASRALDALLDARRAEHAREASAAAILADADEVEEPAGPRM